MKTNLLLLFFLSISCIGFSQSQEEKMEWTEHLTWKDFKGEIDKSSKFHAMTYSSISYAVKGNKNGKPTITVKAFFSPDFSWHIPDKATDELLSHEQFHFALTELNARRLSKELEKLEEQSPERLNQIVKKKHRNFVQRNKREHRKYDYDSNHHENKEKQKEWEKKITKELEELSAYNTAEVNLN